MEEKKAQKLIGKIEDEKIEKNEFLLGQLKERVGQLDKDLVNALERGDDQYSQLREEIKDQDEEESQLSVDINQMANRSNIVLRSKLNANKGDFERLRQLGQIEGPLGTVLEDKVEQSDKAVLGITRTKRNAHKGLLGIRDAMRTNIGMDQKPLHPDLSQVEHACDLLDEKEARLYSDLMLQKDKKGKEYLANEVSNGLKSIMQSDKVDIEQHINFNESGMEKLQKIITKQDNLSLKQEDTAQAQDKTLLGMDEQCEELKGEKLATIEEINTNKEELERLKLLLEAKKMEIDDCEDEMAAMDNKIDNNFDIMEEIEGEVDEKTATVKALEKKLAALLNKKPEPVRPANQIYMPVRGDEIDERLAEYINAHGTPVPWRRISQGNYTYGTKKVSVKYMRSHLIIKVGGGSMMVEEFAANYEDIELAKMNYQNPGGPIATQDSTGLSKQQKVALARGATNVGSPRASKSMVMGSPKSKSFALGRSGSGRQV